MGVKGRREDTKIRVAAVNRSAVAASLGAAKDAAVIPNLTERKTT